MTKNATQEERLLLRQGIADYVDAINAIDAFQSLIRRECRDIVKANIDDYASALGIPASKLILKDGKWTEDGAHSLFVSCTLGKDTRIDLCHGISWWRDAGEKMETALCFWVYSKRVNIDGLKQILLRKKIKADELENSYVSLNEKQTLDNSANFDSKLESLMQRWIKLWRTVGGIKAIGVKSP